MSEYFRKYIKKDNYPVQPSSIRFKTLFRNCIYESLKRRNWKETDHETDWEILWAEKEGVHDVLDHMHLGPNQRVNHFRNDYEMCRKDNLIKNLKRQKKLLEKEGKLDEAAAYNFFPSTYNLPSEYSIFCEEFKKNPNTVWIMKPIGKAQGKGIFLFNKLSQVSQWRSETRWKPESPQVENYIVQRYINNPLLIGGKKFDLRLYCLVTSYSPLTAYFYKNGFARFTHHRYDSEDISNAYVHLTNVAIQKTSENYDEKLGGKWDLRTLKLYLMSHYGQDEVNECFMAIQNVIIKTLQAVQRIIINDKHCFELYGFDVLIDSQLRPWLIEVNGSPSMTANTPQDFELKCSLLDDVFTIVDFEKVLTGQETQIGGFDLIFKGVPVTIETSQFSTMLGCYNNRSQQLKKLAKALNVRLTHANQQDKADGKKPPTSNKGREVMSTAASDTSGVSKVKAKINTRTIPDPVGAKITKPTITKQNTLQNKESINKDPRDNLKDMKNNPNIRNSKTKLKDPSPGRPGGLPPINGPNSTANTEGSTMSNVPSSTASYRTSVAHTGNMINQPSYPGRNMEKQSSFGKNPGKIGRASPGDLGLNQKSQSDKVATGSNERRPNSASVARPGDKRPPSAQKLPPRGPVEVSKGVVKQKESEKIVRKGSLKKMVESENDEEPEEERKVEYKYKEEDQEEQEEKDEEDDDEDEDDERRRDEEDDDDNEDQDDDDEERDEEDDDDSRDGENPRQKDEDDDDDNDSDDGDRNRRVVNVKQKQREQRDSSEQSKEYE